MNVVHVPSIAIEKPRNTPWKKRGIVMQLAYTNHFLPDTCITLGCLSDEKPPILKFLGCHNRGPNRSRLLSVGCHIRSLSRYRLAR